MSSHLISHWLTSGYLRDRRGPDLSYRRLRQGRPRVRAASLPQAACRHLGGMPGEQVPEMRHLPEPAICHSCEGFLTGTCTVRRTARGIIRVRGPGRPAASLRDAP